MDLRDKRALITGGTSGMGSARVHAQWNVARDHGEPGRWPSRHETTEVDARGELRSDLASVLDACCSRANLHATSLGDMLVSLLTARPAPPAPTTPQQFNPAPSANLGLTVDTRDRAHECHRS